MYADDIALMSPSIAGLRTLVSICESYGIEHDIVFHPKKSECMYFIASKFGLTNDMVPPVYLSGKKLNVVLKHIYLGDVVMDNLSDEGDIRRQTRKFYCYANSLIRKFSNCNNDVKVSLFRTYCTNMYCSQVWWQYSQKCMNNLRVAYNNAFRILMSFPRDCSASGMCVTNRVPSFQALRRNLLYKFSVRLHSSDNSLLTKLLSSDAFVRSKFQVLFRKSVYF